MVCWKYQTQGRFANMKCPRVEIPCKIQFEQENHSQGDKDHEEALVSGCFGFNG